MLNLSSTTLQLSMSVRPDGATLWRQWDVATWEAEEKTLAYLALFLAYFAVAGRAIIRQWKTEITWLKLIIFAILNNKAAYNGLAWQQT